MKLSRKAKDAARRSPSSLLGEPLLHRRDVCLALGVDAPTLRRLVVSKAFPQPFRLAPRTPVWRESVVREWLEARERDTAQHYV